LRKLAEKSIAIQEFPFRRWTMSGLEIWMGKNGKQNDELLRQVHKDDIWLHARNHSGSHVVIRSAGKKVPQPVLEAAACWAAWHSKGKTENLCAVMYTQRKFVRKPKGALPGAVIVEKESTLLVHPSPPPAS
jgi:predicted ribosome quality control (RQC) complex YloA/Tae2 family protein